MRRNGIYFASARKVYHRAHRVQSINMPKRPRVELKAAIELFIAEFSAFETHFVGMVLRSLSSDASFVAQTEKLLDLEARLELLRRMAFVRNLDPCVIAQLDDVKLRAGRLRHKRDELSRNLDLIEMDGGALHAAQSDQSTHALATAGRAAPKNMCLPTIAEIDECRSGTSKLQAILRSIADQLDRRHVHASQ